MIFKKTIVSVVLAMSMMTMSACDIFGDDTAEGNSVKLVLNGGSVENNLTNYKDGQEIVLPVPARDNFDFIGWYTQSDCEGESVSKISSTDTGDKTFYAKWSPKTFTVTLNANGGTLSENLTSYVYLTGATLPEAEKTGYAFGGWYADEALTGNSVSVISSSDSGNKIFYAKWNANVYEVKLILNGGEIINNITSYTYGNRVELGEPSKKGNRFLGWYTNASFEGARVTEISATEMGNKTFYAKWEEAYGNVTLHANGGTLSENLTQYQEGYKVDLPVPAKNNYDFAGWYDNQDFNGTAYYEIPETAKGNQEFWAKWTAKKYSVTLVLDGGTLSSTLNEYTYGTGATLPEATRTGFTFEGWYTQKTGGTKVEKISASDSGDKTFYARWGAKLSSDISITACEGYNEGIYVEFPKIKNVSDSGYSVEYKKHTDGDEKYKAIDKELIRINSETNTIRADIVGISAGSYDVVVKAGNLDPAVKSDIKVTAHDRSGYAHFKASEGVGGYNADGLPKDGAVIVYVSEATKNTVQAKIDGKTYTGLVSILNASTSATPVIVRILGTIGAATWNTLEYNTGDDIAKKEIKPEQVVSADGTKRLIDYLSLAEGGRITQQKLIDNGFNTLNTSVYSELKGLTSFIKYDSGKGEFDSCWNDCSVDGARNLTVEGIGTDARIFQWGMTFKNSKSIEISNITFEDYTEDACSFEGDKKQTTVDTFTTQRTWLHNNTFEEGYNYWDVCNEQDKHDGDGSTDFKYCSYITLAYNHYVKTHKTGLIGGANDQLTANVTFHHNYYEGCRARLPLARQANMHMYNNYYHDSTDTSISLRANAYAFIEYCYFDGANNKMINIQGMGTDKAAGTYGVAKLYNCVMDGKGGYTYQSLNAEDNTEAKKKLMIVDVGSDRAKKVANSNTFGQNFDTDSTKFYYDSTNNVSKVSNLITDTAKVKTEIPKLAGVLKAVK